LKGDNVLDNAEERIMRAAKLGGADEVIEDIKGLDKKRGELFKHVPTDEKEATAEGSAKMASEDSWNINVAPVVTWEGSFQVRGSKLGDMSEEVEKKIQLSGGQWQRLALARMFMRAERDQVRLVCTDEPSAALDPRAEFGKHGSCICPSLGL
jgi:ABC-type multidrug transport system fused ATPase/permease subunit